MERTTQTARQIYDTVRANPARSRFGIGARPALVNIDLQKVYTRPELYRTAYENDPRQIEHINRLAQLFRARGWPVVWTYVAYMQSGEDAGIWGTRSDTPDSLQNIKFGSDRAAFDERCEIDGIKAVRVEVAERLLGQSNRYDAHFGIIKVTM